MDIKTKVAEITIMFLHKVLLCVKRETISISNFFSNNIKRAVRSNFKYKREHWMEIK